MDHFQDFYRATFISGQICDVELVKHVTRILSSGLSADDTDESTLPPLTYEPLAMPSNIRVLELLPGTLYDRVRCKLHVEDLQNDANVYTALSYVWGDPENRLPIECDGKEALVTVNLYSALLRLRYEIQPRRLWVDALCINQGTDAAALRERESQVQMMSQIYSRAQEVIVDLGGADKDFEKLLFVFCQFDVEPLSAFETAAREGRILENFKALNFISPFWPSFENFMKRPWFRRAWVVQEFVLGKHVNMMVGGAQFPWEFLARVIERIVWHTKALTGVQGSQGSEYGFSADFTEMGRTYRSYRKICEIRFSRHHPSFREAPGFATLLDLSFELKATNPRDHIYALLGLVNDLNPVNMAVNYSESPSALSLRVAKYLIAQGKCAYVLCRAGGIDPERASWAPSLRVFTQGNRLGRQVCEDGSCELYQACSQTSPAIRLGSGAHDLIVRGAMLDSIACTSRAGPSWDLGLYSVSTVNDPRRLQELAKGGTTVASWYNEVHAWASEQFKHLAHEDFKEHFWRTLVLDETGDQDPDDRGSRATPDFGRHFEAHESYAKMKDWIGVHEVRPSDELMSRWEKGAPFVRSFVKGCTGRRLCRTNAGVMAMAPETVEMGDQIWVFLGVPVPFIIRKATTSYNLVGPCYVHGMMDGQALKSESWSVQDITLT